MEHNKEYYQSLIRVIDCLLSSTEDIKPDKGKELAGVYWGEIGEYLKMEAKVGWFTACHFRILENKTDQLCTIKVKCLYKIKEIEEAEADRELANREKIENITYGRKGYKLSKIAIWLSAIAILVEIARGIADLLL